MKIELSEKVIEIIKSTVELSVDELNQLIAQLQREIEIKQDYQKKIAINKIREMASEAGISVTFEDAIKKRKTGAKPGSQAKIKYRNKTTGDEWSGRGIKPKWIKELEGAGKDINDFLTDEFKQDRDRDKK